MSERPLREVVPGRPAAPQVVFCGYCGARPEDPPAEPSRVCAECQLGLLLRAAAELAPEPGDAFLVVDDLLRVRAVSRGAERVLAVAETAAVDHALAEFLLPADATADAGAMRTAVVHGLFGGDDTGEPFRMAVRPHDTHGVRFAARFGPCQPGPAALVVLSPLGDGADALRPRTA